MKTNDTKTEYKVEGLKEKMVYQFRVKAYNKAGVGEASQPTDNHLCKHKNCKYLSYTIIVICYVNQCESIRYVPENITMIKLLRSVDL